ncbi:MAG: serine/threonine-protein kinase [Deltaproteobacteria bacterium]
MQSVTNLSEARPGPGRVPLRAGQVIAERYRLEELLERGAMGSVWRAEAIRLRSAVAVKFLEPALIGVPEMRDRFMQEARSAAAIRSAHVVQIYDYGSEGDVPYIAMELLLGESLDARLSALGRLTPSELNKIFSEVARGIGQAHVMGVVHRDVKPGNIFLAREGQSEVAKLIDFGIAKVKADALKFTHIIGTQRGTLLGTPQYMSPEQVRGSIAVDHRTDLWALAIIACECLTGRYPFAGTTIGDLAVQICTEQPYAPSALGPVPAGFDQWFFKGTAKKPGRRFASVEEMAGALDKILSASSDSVSGRHTMRGFADEISTLAVALHSGVVARVQSERLSLVRLLRSRRQWVVAALLLVVLGCGLGFWGLGFWGLGFWSSQRGVPARAAREPELAQTLQAASPAPAEPHAQPLMVVPAAAAPLPATSEDVVPARAASVIAGTATAAPTPAQVPSAPRRSKRLSRPSTTADTDRVTPFGPMSVAMGEAGARMAQGKRRAARSAAAPRGAANAPPPWPVVPVAKPPF